MKTTAFLSAALAIPSCHAFAPAKVNNAAFRSQGTELEMGRSVGKLDLSFAERENVSKDVSTHSLVSLIHKTSHNPLPLYVNTFLGLPDL